jgi:type VI protein secretion system component VasA
LDNLSNTEQAQQIEQIQDLHTPSDSVSEQQDRELTWKLLALLFFIGFSVVTALYLTK